MYISLSCHINNDHVVLSLFNKHMGGSGDLGECVQAPIARRLAPNVCSALAPPGACSQATNTCVSVKQISLFGSRIQGV